MQANYPDNYVVTLWDILVFIEPTASVELVNRFNDTKDYSMRGIADLLMNFIREIDADNINKRSISFVEHTNMVYYTEGEYDYRIKTWILDEIFHFERIN